MADIVSTVKEKLEAAEVPEEMIRASSLLSSLVEAKAYVGEVYSLGYHDALVQIHDYHRQQVGGIPALSFLIATRVDLSNPIDVRQEDASILLL